MIRSIGTVTFRRSDGLEVPRRQANGPPPRTMTGRRLLSVDDSVSVTGGHDAPAFKCERIAPYWAGLALATARAANAAAMRRCMHESGR